MNTTNLTPATGTEKIETYLPVFPGFYGTLFEPENDLNYLESDYLTENLYIKDPKNFDLWSLFNNSGYEEAISREACNFIEHELSEFIVSIEFQSLSRPREYNFRNDSINCAIEPKIEKIRTFIYDNKPAFCKYLEDNLKSRPGFISFYSYSFADWIEYTKDFTDFSEKGLYLGFILEFIFQELQENMYESMYYYCSERVYTGSFLDYSEIDQNIEEIKDFARQNYSKLTIEEITEEAAKKFDCMLTYLEDLDVERIVKDVFNEID